MVLGSSRGSLRDNKPPFMEPQNRASESLFGTQMAQSAEDLAMLSTSPIYQSLEVEGCEWYFRLLELCPGPALQEVDVRLMSYDLRDCPSYEALSYCWNDTAGLESKDYSVRIGSVNVTVTANLFSALQHLRDGETTRILWVDALCIDQSNISEREKQVTLMEKIYSGAERTLVWLGPTYGGSDLAIRACKRLVLSLAQDDDPKMESFRAPDFDNLCQLLSRDKDSPGAPSEIGIAALARLVKRKWFSRIWVVQEIALAREVIVTCGKHEIEFDTLYLAFATSIAFSKSIVKGRPEWIDLFNVFSAARELRFDENPSLFSLSNLLNLTRRFRSTDDRDKIFGLFGMTSTPVMTLGLRPDYRATSSDVFQRVARALLKESDALELLEIPGGKTSLRQKLPSWVPDWSDCDAQQTSLTDRRPDKLKVLSTGSSRQKALLQRIYNAAGMGSIDEKVWLAIEKESNRERDEGLKNRIPLFSAAASSKSVFRFYGSSSLCLSGHVIDKIIQIGSTAIPAEFDQEMIQTFKENKGTTFKAIGEFLGDVISQTRKYLDVELEWERLALKNTKSSYPTGESQETAYCQTLCAGYHPNGYRQAAQDFKSHQRHLRGPRLLEMTRLRLPDTLVALSASASAVMEGSGVNAFRGVNEVMLRRRLARTAKGYLGLVPDESHVGDVIALLRGGRLPFILRACGENWELIGASYVHGIMYGEAFEEGRCGDVTLV